MAVVSVSMPCPYRLQHLGLEGISRKVPVQFVWLPRVITPSSRPAVADTILKVEPGAA